MPNSYGKLEDWKTLNDITGSGNDAVHLRLLEQASRQIDDHLRTFFFARTQTRYFAGSADPLWLDFPLLSVTTLKTDTSGNATFDTTFATTDYVLWPYSDFPKTRIDLSDDGDQSDFGSGTSRGVELVGLWGWGDALSATPYTDSGQDINDATDISATQTTITYDGTAAVPLSIGDTILIDSEQMYVTGDASSVLTVLRGVNGTTAATHLNNASISIYDYPGDVIQATYSQASMLWSAAQASESGERGGNDVGMTQRTDRGLHPAAKALKSTYHTPRIA